MKFEIFLSTNKISLPKLTSSLCMEGIQMMKNSIDILHTDNHYYRLLTYLHHLLRNEPKRITSKIDMEVLLLAICWHDVWRVKRLPRSYLFMFFDDMFEGIGSVRIFAKRAKEVKLSDRLINQVEYAIRKHTRFQIFPPRTLEAKILREIDYLDLFSMERLTALKRVYLSDPKNINKKILKLGKFYFDQFVARINESTFRFNWTKTEFKRKRKILVKEVNKYVEKYKQLK